MSDHYTTDILVIGAGPAGSAFVRALPDSVSAVLVDKRQLTRAVPYPDKPCGGLLAPASQACLVQMGLAVPAEVLMGPQIFGVRAIDLESGHGGLFQRHYMNISRDRFDRWLFSLAARRPRTTPLIGRRFVSCVEDADGILATFDEGSTVRAKLLVGADGAQSRVRRALGEKKFSYAQSADVSLLQSIGAFWRSRRLLAVQAWFERTQEYTEYGAYFHRKVTDQYAWMIPKGEHVLVGAMMPWPQTGTANQAAVEAKVKMDILFDALRTNGIELGAPFRTESCAVLSPGLGIRFPLGARRTILLGEAAGFISPSSAEGISFALRSGMMLAGAVGAVGIDAPSVTGDHPVLSEYRKRVRRMTYELRSKWLKGTVMFRPRLRRMTLASGAGMLSARW